MELKHTTHWFIVVVTSEIFELNGVNFVPTAYVFSHFKKYESAAKKAAELNVGADNRFSVVEGAIDRKRWILAK